MVHQGHITHLRLGSSKAFIIVALVSAAVYGPRAMASLPSSVLHLAPAGATVGSDQEFGGALAPTRVVPLYRERTSSAKLARVQCPGQAQRGVGCYELG